MRMQNEAVYIKQAYHVGMEYRTGGTRIGYEKIRANQAKEIKCNLNGRPEGKLVRTCSRQRVKYSGAIEAKLHSRSDADQAKQGKSGF